MQVIVQSAIIAWECSLQRRPQPFHQEGHPIFHQAEEQADNYQGNHHADQAAGPEEATPSHFP